MRMPIDFALFTRWMPAANLERPVARRLSLPPPAFGFGTHRPTESSCLALPVGMRSVSCAWRLIGEPSINTRNCFGVWPS